MNATRLSFALACAVLGSACEQDPCTIVQIGDDSVLACPDGSNFVLRGGPAGEDGADGADGMDGAEGPQGPQGPMGAPGTNGTNGMNGVDGAAGLNGFDGESCTLVDNEDDTATLTCGDDSFTIASGSGEGGPIGSVVTATINPGSHLTLSHGFDDSFVVAQVRKGERLLSLDEYNAEANAEVGTTQLIADRDDFNIEQNPMKFAGDETSGAVIFLDANSSHYYSVALGEDGSPTGPATQISDTNDNYSHALVRLTDGSFVWAFAAGGGWPQTNYLRRFAADFTPIATEEINVGDDNVGTIRLTALPDGGFVVAYRGYDPDTDSDRIYVGAFDNALTQTTAFVDVGARRNEFSVHTRADGSVGLVSEEDDGDTIRGSYATYTADLTPVSSIPVYFGYARRPCLATADDGTVLIAYEAGSPDTGSFVLLAPDGSIHRRAVFTDEEPNDVTCGYNGDGGFYLFSQSTNSYAVASYELLTDGTLRSRPHYLFGGTDLTGSDIGVLPRPNHDALVILRDNQKRLIAQRVSRGRIELTEPSTGTARLRNLGAESLDVQLSAIPLERLVD